MGKTDMDRILLIGAGRSAYYCVDYLAKQAEEEGWQLTVADSSADNLADIAGHNSNITTQTLDLDNSAQRQEAIATHDVVISLAPPYFHPFIARDCLDQQSHFLTASYLTADLEAMHKEAEEKGLLFLTELGLDPGLDHLSAQQAIDDLKTNGAKIKGFYSYTGGLVAPKSDNNPWRYKISWNPLNVVRTGNEGAHFFKNGKQKLVPYQQLFKRTTAINVPDYGTFEAYYNRNSLRYAKRYGLQNAETVIRGTLRWKGFCASWDLLVQTGLTEHRDQLQLEGRTLSDFTNMFLPEPSYPEQTLETRWADLLGVWPTDEAFQRLVWLGLTSDDPVPIAYGTPAEVLKNLLVKKIGMEAGDRDLVLMVHYFDFEINGERRTRKSYLTLEGKTQQKTAMAKTVGLPLAIGTRLVMEGQLDIKGVHLPMKADIYEPILEELKRYGIIFREFDYELEP